MNKIKLGKLKLNKKFFTYYYLGIGLFIIILIATVFTLRPGALVIDDGGGGYVPPPPPVIPVEVPDETVTFEPPVPPVPDAPLLLCILPFNDIDGEIHLSWSFVYDAITYYLYRSKDGSAYEVVATISLFMYIDYVDASGTYSYKVRAEGVSGMSEDSNIQQVVVTLPLPPEEPTAPPEIPQDTDILTGNTQINFVIGIAIVVIGVSLTSLYFYFLFRNIKKQRGIKK